MSLTKQQSRKRRHVRVRKKVRGTTERPRLAVFRSAKHIYAQVIDDLTGTTLVSASSVEPSLKAAFEQGVTGGNLKGAEAIGKAIAERSLEKGIKRVVFDRSGYIYASGRVRALAEGARSGGLQF